MPSHGSDYSVSDPPIFDTPEKLRQNFEGQLHLPIPISDVSDQFTTLHGGSDQQGYSCGGDEYDEHSQTSDNDTSPANTLDRSWQYFAEDVRRRTKPPDTAEIDIDENPSLPYDPNLVCPKCGKRYRIGEIQKFKRHVLEKCPYRDPADSEY